MSKPASPSAQPPLGVIVTPVYNGQNYLEETMASVQAQDYPNLLHIVLDNASTDKTPAIVARYAGARIPVRTIRNPAVLPIGQNWNAAVSLIPTEAKYFRVLSADDLIAPQFMSRAIDVLERHPNVGVVAVLFHENDGSTIDPRWPADGEVIAGPEAIKLYFRDLALLPSLHAVYRRSAAPPGRPFFDEALTAFDLDATFRALCRSDMGLVRADLAMTRLHPGTITSQVLDRERRHYYEWLYFLQRYGAVGLGQREAEAIIKRYRRQYLRLLIKWYLKGNREMPVQHLKNMAKLGIRPNHLQFADALLDWLLVKLRARTPWVGYPYLN
ncbi:MAG: glycosyltransferase family A protein [Hyphomicrobiaceae bacterium]